ncbi:MAG: DUF1275 domain-containing protein [Labilithrix sp.]|nr:DUF1275 domain-containing protein [Labilithrix sp.]
MVVYRPHEVTSLRHLGSWALLAFSAGAVNAGALLACQRFVAHVTGTVTRIGVDAGDFLALDYLLVLVAFIAGAASAILLARKVGAQKPAYWLPLTLVSLTLVGVALAGHAGLFGVFGGTVETAHDFALLAILSFAMGMQNAAVAASTAMAVRTTHMTGPATDLAIALAVLASGDGKERDEAKRSILLRTTKLVAFVTGAVAMTLIGSRLGFLAFTIPAVTGLLATARSFMPKREGEGTDEATA